jgi:diguanylate cyclase (GGDEF)-like protein
VIRFDIDHYKDLYRKHGEEVGDGILVWLAQLVTADARVEDTVARVAGAKFALLATATDMESARQLCQRLRKHTHNKPFLNKEGVAVGVTLSFGLASLGQDKMSNIEELLTNNFTSNTSYVTMRHEMQKDDRHSKLFTSSAGRDACERRAAG